MISHIIFESEYSYRYFQLIRQNFSIEDHFFIIHGKGVRFNPGKFEYTDALYTHDFSEAEVNNVLRQSQAIIISGYFSGSISNFFFDKSDYLKKLNWLVWGEDIFRLKTSDFIIFFNKFSLRILWNQLRLLKWNVEESLKSNNIPFYYSIQEMRRNIVIKNMQNIIADCLGDFEIIKKNYKTNANYIYSFHSRLFEWDKLEQYLIVSDLLKNDSKRSSYNLLMGNSGSLANQHLDFFQSIKHIDTDQVKFYCPLSYGDPQNIKNVITEGEQIFHEAFVPITALMNINEYNLFLSKIDVAFFNHDQQEGLGTIIALLILGAKIYIKFNIPSYQYLSEKGIILYNISEISSKTSLPELINYDSEIRFQNREIAINQFSDDAWVIRWKEIFNQLQNT